MPERLSYFSFTQEGLLRIYNGLKCSKKIEKTVKWGILGCGDVTEVKSGPAYQQVSGFELHAVMRRDLVKAEDYARRHQVPKFYGDADALINDPAVDAVYIATPPDSHARYAFKVAAAGKICCIEKPMAPSYEDCLAIQEAFESKKLPLFVAYYRRSLPRFEKVRSWLEASKIGDIRHVSLHLSKAASPLDLSGAVNWRTQASIAYGWYFDDLASHGMDLLLYLLGPIEKVQGHAFNQQKLYTAKDAVVGSWLHKSGVTGSGAWNFGAYKKEDRVEIFGSQGKISFAVFEDFALQLETASTQEHISIENPKHIQSHHVQKIKEHLLGQAPHPSSGKTATHTAWVLDRLLGN
jgi:predicted dehydrogenase